MYLMESNFNRFFENNSNKTLIIVDTQRAFSKYFNKQYLDQLSSYASKFKNTIQIWDNHYKGKNLSLDYLYDTDLTNNLSSELYNFSNQLYNIEKRYVYKVNISYFKTILDSTTYNKIINKKFVKGEMYKTIYDTYIIYIGNNHRWFHIPMKLYNYIINNLDTNFTIVGGADRECLEDIYITFKSLGAKIEKNPTYIWSAKYCPIK